MDNIFQRLTSEKNLEWSTKIFVCINYAHYYSKIFSKNTKLGVLY